MPQLCARSKPPPPLPPPPPPPPPLLLPPTYRPSPTLHPLHPQITFPAPVVLTSARVGAAPSAGPAGQRSQLLRFAQDAGAPAAARFVQLCPGFEQPDSGSRVVQLQVSGSVQAMGTMEVLGLAIVNRLHSFGAVASRWRSAAWSGCE